MKWYEERWPIHTLYYNPQRLIVQLLAMIAVELLVVIALVAS